MKKVIGFALFFIAAGLLISLFLPNTFFIILIIVICLLAGYNLFCCGK